MTTEEATFNTRDGTSLYTKTWNPSAQSHLHLIFIHGFSDHINAYYNLFPTLSSPPYNITVYGFDQRGWGRSVPENSPSSRGLTGDTTLVLNDIHDFIIHVSKQITTSSASPSTTSPTKLFMMGHSMGGAETLYYALRKIQFSPHLPIALSGILVESPHIAFPPAAQPSSLLVISGRIAAKVLPNMQKVEKLDSSAMSRNPQICKDWDNDPLCHDTGTLRGLAGLLDRANHLDDLGKGKDALWSTGTLSEPVFWAHGDEDKVVDFEASQRLFERVGRSQVESKFVRYKGGYHKIHGEPEGMGEQFARDVGEWICRVGGGGGGDIEEVESNQVVQQSQQSKDATTASTGTTADNEVRPEDIDGGKSKSRL